jgi:hypothetical protein
VAVGRDISSDKTNVKYYGERVFFVLLFDDSPPIAAPEWLVERSP